MSLIIFIFLTEKLTFELFTLSNNISTGLMLSNIAFKLPDIKRFRFLFVVISLNVVLPFCARIFVEKVIVASCINVCIGILKIK